jgi:hypothetical protein
MHSQTLHLLNKQISILCHHVVVAAAQQLQIWHGCLTLNLRPLFQLCISAFQKECGDSCESHLKKKVIGGYPLQSRVHCLGFCPM